MIKKEEIKEQNKEITNSKPEKDTKVISNDSPEEKLLNNLPLDEILKQARHDNDERTALLDERERNINERELRADFNTNLKRDLKSFHLDLSDSLVESINSFIDYSDNDTYKQSYSKVIDLIKNITKSNNLNVRGYKGPRSNKSLMSNSIIEKAFKPPKTY